MYLVLDLVEGPDLTPSISILSYDYLAFSKFYLNLNRVLLYNIRRACAEQLQKRFYNKNLLFISRVNKKHTINANEQKVDIKLSKICQNHQKLSEWQKLTPGFKKKFRRLLKLFVEY